MALKPVSSCSLLISPSWPSSCLLSTTRSSCPTEDKSQDISSTLTTPPPPGLHTTNKPQHKDSQMTTWRTNTQATPALLCV
uniref:Uncharacterized protein n=1 Tax=Scophthalmus maximus TaxID=52904 RepID=A0A8D3A1T8_SCOMX